MTTTQAESDTGRVRRQFRIHTDTLERVKYWGAKRDLTENEYFVLAIEEKIARENGDYDLPTLEIMRLNQLIDEMRANSTNVANLEAIVTSGFASLMGLTRGDSYLLDDDDGELGAPDTASAIAGA